MPSRLGQAPTCDHDSMGRVRGRGFARRTCCLVLLLLQVLLLHEGKNMAADDEPERIASERQLCLKRA